MINAGTYRARATGEQDVQFGYAGTGSEQVAVLFELLDDQDQPAGERVTWFGSFASDKSQAIALKALRNAGWQGDNLCDLAGLGSSVVELVIAYEADQNGTDRLRVQWVNKPGEGGRVALKNQMDEGQKRAFAARMRGVVLSMGGAPGVASARPAARPAPQPRPQPRPANGAPAWDGTGPDPEDDPLPF